MGFVHDFGNLAAGAFSGIFFVVYKNLAVGQSWTISPQFVNNIVVTIDIQPLCSQFGSKLAKLRIVRRFSWLRRRGC